MPLTECRNPRRIATSSASGRARDEPPHALNQAAGPRGIEKPGRKHGLLEVKDQTLDILMDRRMHIGALRLYRFIGLPDTAQLMGHDLHCGCNVER